MRIIIDADSVPKEVLAICTFLSQECKIPLWTVASFNHLISPQDTHHTHLTVGNASQETDIKIMNLAFKGDIVVTQDYGLAAMLLGKGVKVLSPHGKIFNEENIDFLLEKKEINAYRRRLRLKTKGPKKRKEADDQNFKKALVELIKENIKFYKKVEFKEPLSFLLRLLLK